MEEHQASLRDILEHSPFNTEEELLTELRAIESSCSSTGTRIIIWNLRRSGFIPMVTRLIWRTNLYYCFKPTEHCRARTLNSLWSGRPQNNVLECLKFVNGKNRPIESCNSKRGKYTNWWMVQRKWLSWRRFCVILFTQTLCLSWQPITATLRRKCCT